MKMYDDNLTSSPSQLNEARQLTFDTYLRPITTEAHLGIDVTFPQTLANTLAQQEAYNKHLFRPNTYLHKWWARRCGSTFRFILKQFVADPAYRDYYTPGGLEGKIILDPMMGGGTTLHEALRLGASVIGVDIDPVPIAQVRAALSPLDLAELRRTFADFFNFLYAELGALFQTECPICEATVDANYTLYGLRKRCACGEIVQIDQYDLRHEPNRVVRIHPKTWQITDDAADVTTADTRPPLIPKTKKVCPTCGERYQELSNVTFYARYMPFAVVGHCQQHGLFFRHPGTNDLERIAKAEQRRAMLDFGPPEAFTITNGPKSRDLVRHGIHSYLDVFSTRQLLYLDAAIRYLNAPSVELPEAIRLNLALLVSTSLEFNAMLCGYKGWFARRPGAIRHVFTLHAYALPYTALENNPLNLQPSSGNLQRLFRDRQERGRVWASAPVERRVKPDGKTQLVTVHGEWDGGIEVSNQTDLLAQRQAFWLLHRDARNLPLAAQSVDFIVTDPPYYDSVQYSDLAAFFRVWLARLLPDALEWDYDTAHSAVAMQSDTNNTDFMRILGSIFRECARVLKPEIGRLVFTFHHWDPHAWAELTLALRTAGFRLVNRYVVFSENPISVHINNLNAIKHDTILVLTLHEPTTATQWQPLTHIPTTDSERFCRDCGTALGWLVDSEFKPEEIRQIWQKLIQKGKNDVYESAG